MRAVGLLDFQDALMGPAAYDAASRCCRTRASTCRKRWRVALLEPLRAGAAAAPKTAISTWRRSPGSTRHSTAQRATKILGIFARLDRRDGKPQYLAAHAAAVGVSAQRSLAHPALAPLRAWYTANVRLRDGL